MKSQMSLLHLRNTRDSRTALDIIGNMSP